MEKFCVFCGLEMDKDGKCVNGHNLNKKMCVNCQHVQLTDNGYFCAHEGNMSEAKSKMIEAATNVSNGFPFTIEVSPLPLKKPTLKCGNWALSEVVINDFKNSFK